MLIGSRYTAVNGLHLPANQAVAYLRGCCTPMWARNHISAYPFSFRGSSFLYRRRGQHYAIFTSHQVGQWKMDDMSISLQHDSKIIQNGSSYIGYSDGAQTHEGYDLCAMVLARAAILRNKDHETLFFNSMEAPRAEGGDNEHFFALGYPSQLVDLECTDKIESVDLSQVRVVGSWVAPASSDSLHGLHIQLGMVMAGRCGGNFDGFSGGPVFSIHAARKIIEFRGIVIRGGGPALYFAPTHWIDAMCDGD